LSWEVNSLSKILGLHSGVTETSRPLTMWSLHCLATLGTKYPVAWQMNGSLC
jgi:hypothetical protein